MRAAGIYIPAKEEILVDLVTVFMGRAMVQAVSRQPLTVEARFRARVSPRGICGGQSGPGTEFSLSYSNFPSQCQSTVALVSELPQLADILFIPQMI
jgi:hypothetical protein